MRGHAFICASVLLAMSGAASAVPIVNGSIAGDNYGPARAIQTVNTEFGDNQSELNAAYARVEAGRLYIALTGNIEANFNKLNVFIHTGAAGGQNTITPDFNFGGSNPDNDGWANTHAGMTFDTGFDANYMLIFRRGFDGTNNRFDVDLAQVGGGPGAFVSYGNIFGGTTEGAATLAPFGLLSDSLQVAYDNSNIAGVGGGPGAADQAAALAVLTGLEFSISLADLGNPDIGDIRISAMVNGSGHNYLSNQILGGLGAPQGNLGGDGAGGFIGNLSGINLNNFAGEQWFTVPAPGALALLGLGGLVATRRRR